MDAELISPDDPRWLQTLSRVQYDFYHLPEYVMFSAKHEGGTPIAFYAEDGNDTLLMPLLLREIPSALGISESWYDVTTPYGYPSPILTSEYPLTNFLTQFKIFAQKNNIVSAFFRLHPLFVLPAETLSQYGTLLKHGSTVYVDLSVSQEELWRQTRSNHKANIRKLLKAGFKAQIGNWKHFEEFFAIYGETMARLSARKFYRFSNTYFQELRAALGERLCLCTVLDSEQHIVSAGLFTITNGIVQYHLGGTSTPYLRFAPSKLMFHCVRSWAKENNCHYLHLGGGVGEGGGSLFQFKIGFSKLTADFYTYRMILDEDKYALLVKRWKESRNNQEDEGRPTDFFPEYRSPTL